VRLNKFIAQSGYCSRRKADEFISDGAVTVNGNIIRELGAKIDPIKDKVKVEGNKINAILSKTYIAFYKPRGIVTTMSGNFSFESVVDQINVPGLFHVGRLDQESEGLIFLTNDGEWANQVSHPKFETRKVYEVGLNREAKEGDLEMLLSGVTLSDGLFKADLVEKLGSRNVRLSIHDGRNRIIRRVFAELDYEVMVLKRVAIGDVRLGRMKPGQWKEINPYNALHVKH
jgi:23S rRNA pseudouridine2605 synthase